MATQALHPGWSRIFHHLLGRYPLAAHPALRDHPVARLEAATACWVGSSISTMSVVDYSRRRRPSPRGGRGSSRPAVRSNADPAPALRSKS